MKALPYFRWFPADAEGDDFYMSLSRDEFWLYHRCLNRSWMNDGIPADLDELARIFKITRKQLDKWWVKVGQKWIQSPRDPLKLIDRRLEKEHAHVLKMGEANRRPGNANAAKTKREENADETRTRFSRDPNGPQHAYARADSVCVSGSSGLEIPRKQETSPRACDFNGQVSQRFNEFWDRYPRQVGKDSACQDWISVAMAADESAIFACLDNYLASGDVARGAVMNAGSTPRGIGWIVTCAKEHWACRWPSGNGAKTKAELRAAELENMEFTA